MNKNLFLTSTSNDLVVKRMNKEIDEGEGGNNIENGTWKWAKSYPGNVYCSHRSIEAGNNKPRQVWLTKLPAEWPTNGLLAALLRWF